MRKLLLKIWAVSAAICLAVLLLVWVAWPIGWILWPVWIPAAILAFNLPIVGWLIHFLSKARERFRSRSLVPAACYSLLALAPAILPVLVWINHARLPSIREAEAARLISRGLALDERPNTLVVTTTRNWSSVEGELEQVVSTGLFDRVIWIDTARGDRIRIYQLITSEDCYRKNIRTIATGSPLFVPSLRPTFARCVDVVTSGEAIPVDALRLHLGDRSLLHHRGWPVAVYDALLTRELRLPERSGNGLIAYDETGTRRRLYWFFPYFPLRDEGPLYRTLDAFKRVLAQGQFFGFLAHALHADQSPTGSPTDRSLERIPFGVNRKGIPEAREM